MKAAGAVRTPFRIISIIGPRRGRAGVRTEKLLCTMRMYERIRTYERRRIKLGGS